MSATNKLHYLKFGQPVVVSKKTKKIRVSFYWSAIANDNEGFNLDVSAISLNKKLKVNDASDVIFYNQTNTNRGVCHAGDNILLFDDKSPKTILYIEPEKIPELIEEIRLILTIHEAKKRNQDFSHIEKVLITFVDDETNLEICRNYFNAKRFSESACEIIRFKKANDSWEIHVRGFRSDKNLQEIFKSYGVI